MSLILELPPELEAELLPQAQAKGVPLDVYVKSILKEHVDPPRPALSMEEWEKAMEEFAAGFPQTPLLSDEAISRESIYSRDE
jgi:hypothetical protein